MRSSCSLGCSRYCSWRGTPRPRRPWSTRQRCRGCGCDCPAAGGASAAQAGRWRPRPRHPRPGPAMMARNWKTHRPQRRPAPRRPWAASRARRGPAAAGSPRTSARCTPRAPRRGCPRSASPHSRGHRHRRPPARAASPQCSGSPTPRASQRPPGLVQLRPRRPRPRLPWPLRPPGLGARWPAEAGTLCQAEASGRAAEPGRPQCRRQRRCPGPRRPVRLGRPQLQQGLVVGCRWPTAVAVLLPPSLLPRPLQLQPQPPHAACWAGR
mmetsp:Transcript_85338/g.276333  ORF Transcript_85338/g.276333 Transcript_85338/m.276333 type:complete len:267 (-) Transcript_85338:1369-2169(-)